MSLGRWFRFYDETLNNRKAQSLPGDLFKHWVNVLCIASKHGGEIPSLADVIFALRVSESKAALIIADLCKRGLLDAVEGRYFRPHDWDDRQFKSDVSNDRVKQHRERKRNAACNVTSQLHATPPETETETETETEKKESESAALRAPTPDVPRETISQKSKRAKARSSLADDWKPSERDLAHATERGFDGAQTATMAAGFSNHHRARGNLMADWGAAWRTWCDNEIKFQRSNGYGPGRQRSLQDDSLSVSKAIDRRLATPGTLVFPPRPSLLPIEREDDCRLLPAGRSAES